MKDSILAILIALGLSIIVIFGYSAMIWLVINYLVPTMIVLGIVTFSVFTYLIYRIIRSYRGKDNDKYFRN